MKQFPPLAKLLDPILVAIVIGFAFLLAACATQPRQTQNASSSAQLSATTPGSDSAPLTNINRATAQELENLPGVGEVIAQRIVAHREQYGPFRRPEHLMMVRGISDRKFRALRPMIIAE